MFLVLSTFAELVSIFAPFSVYFHLEQLFSVEISNTSISIYNSIHFSRLLVRGTIFVRVM